MRRLQFLQFSIELRSASFLVGSHTLNLFFGDILVILNAQLLLLRGHERSHLTVHLQLGELGVNALGSLNQAPLGLFG